MRSSPSRVVTSRPGRRARVRICRRSTPAGSSDQPSHSDRPWHEPVAGDRPHGPLPAGLLYRGRIERALDCIVDIGRDRVVAPEPTHHVRKNRAALLLTVLADAPLIIEVVPLLGERLHQPHVLQEPVASFVVSPAPTDAAVVVAPILQVNPDRLLLV